MYVFANITRQRPDEAWNVFNDVLGRRRDTTPPTVIKLGSREMKGEELAVYSTAAL